MCVTILKLALIVSIIAPSGFSYLLSAEGFFWKLVWMGLFGFGLVFGFLHVLFLGYTLFRATEDDIGFKTFS